MTQFRRNLPLVITGIMITLIVGTRLISTALPDRTGSVDPRVTLTDNEARQILERRQRQQRRAFISVAEGEVSRTEERIRETTALGLATSLLAAKESLSQRIPPTADALLAGVNLAHLLPPGIHVTDRSGFVSSARSDLQIRYQPESLEIEIVSIGKERLDGPALIFRLPQSGDPQLFIATRLDEITIPKPFASEAEIIVSGFTPEPFRALTLPNPDANK
jgi:hypothetical protein